MKTVSPDAQRVYDYLVSVRRLKAGTAEGKHQIELVSELTTEQDIEWSTHLRELMDAEWIKGRGNSSSYTVGFGALKHILFAQPSTDEEELNLLLSRYSEKEARIVRAALSLYEADLGKK